MVVVWWWHSFTEVYVEGARVLEDLGRSFPGPPLELPVRPRDQHTHHAVPWGRGWGVGTNTHIQAHIHTHADMREHAHKQTHTHAHTHSRTHTHAHTPHHTHTTYTTRLHAVTYHSSLATLLMLSMMWNWHFFRGSSFDSRSTTWGRASHYGSLLGFLRNMIGRVLLLRVIIGRY